MAVFKKSAFTSVGEQLLSESSKNMKQDDFTLHSIKITDIVPNPASKYSIREDEVQEMMQSIRDYGLAQNLEVKPMENGKYMVIAGHKRRVAIQRLYEAGEHSGIVPCTFRYPEKIKYEISDELKEKFAIIQTNKVRRTNTDADTLQEIQDLEEIYAALREIGVETYEGQRIKGITTRQLIAERIGKSPAQVGKIQKVQKRGTNEVKQAIKDQKLNINVAEQLVSHPEEIQNTIIDIAEKEGLKSIGASDLRRIEQEIKQDKKEREKEDNEKYQADHKYIINGEEHTDNPGSYTVTKDEFKSDIAQIMKRLLKNPISMKEKEYKKYKDLIIRLQKILER